MPTPLLGEIVQAFTAARLANPPKLRVREMGTVLSMNEGIVVAGGLPDVTNEEMVQFSTGAMGYVAGLQPGSVSIAMLDADRQVRPGTMVWRSGRVLDCPVGSALVGRILDPLGRPLDGLGPVSSTSRRPIERPAPPITMRAPITRPLHTGITVIDAMIPIGRGQRELILGDRGTGKTAIALDTILNQVGQDVTCVYCVIGQQNSAVARAIATLRERGALAYTVVVVAEPELLPGMRFVAPYTAMTIAEWFAESGRDALIVFDDLTQHAQSYRELALLLRRPPGREAFPGDIFYVHSRLLERATQWGPEFGGGSLTALPIVETEAQDLAGYIPTNVVSITDGQIYTTPDLFQKGALPAIDVGRSVSRVGGKAQLPMYRVVSAKLKLAYAQYEELEHFARFGTRMDDETRRALSHGRKVRALLRQSQYATVRPVLQIFRLLLATEGLLEEVPVERAAEVAMIAAARAAERHREFTERIAAGGRLSDEEFADLRSALAVYVAEQI